ncbi:hypothetical protein B0I35DRAFT_514802 [Stachybotrys elegans]|uniref:Rhodopsin domain-containing protein n=1 Tax=Stachybotrys elegans TaxID=80388 RepID=A0A8K0SNV3_9HYPO|nr:hypothetical protein B0I35DRAFT_514802 [Stachybotrys elegans]
MDNEYIGWRLEIAIGIFIPLQIVCVGLRFYDRTLTRRDYGWDDGFIVASLIDQLVLCGIAIGAIYEAGVGYHISYLSQTSPGNVTRFLQFLVAVSMWYTAIINLPNVLGTILLFIVCIPFEANWGPPDIQAAQCWDKRSLFVWFSFPSIVSDFVMLPMPIPYVWKLHMRLQLKITLTLTFLVAGSGFMASILRFLSFMDNNSFIDATWNAVILLTWTVAEPGIYLISACMMMYRPLIERLFQPGNSRAQLPRTRSRKASITVAKTVDGQPAIELGIGSSHRFERLQELDDNDPLPAEHSDHIRITTHIKVSSKSLQDVGRA